MSDQSNQPPADGVQPAGALPNGPAGDAQAKPSIQIAAQYVKDLSFENPNAPQSLSGGQQAPQVSVNVDVRSNKLQDNTYEVVLVLRADAKIADKQAFIAELTYGGVVILHNVPQEHTAPMLLIEGPRLLFPFARAVIAEATRNGGYPPLLVQPIDFADLFRRQLEAMRAQQQAGGAPAAPSTPPQQG